jgi:hypothetical protein
LQNHSFQNCTFVALLKPSCSVPSPPGTIPGHPPRLTSKPVTGRYRTAYGQNLRRGLFVSRADVAHYMLSILDQPGTFGQTIGIAN